MGGVNMTQKELNKQLVSASQEDNTDRIKELFKAGANLNAYDKYGITALMYAAESNYIKTVRTLISLGADVNFRNSKNTQTALMQAAWDNHIKITKLLLDHDADPNTRDKYGRTALIYACNAGHTETARLLLGYGADPNIRDKNGGTALIRASINGHIEVIKLLVDSYADIGTKNEKGRTALDILKTHYPEQYKKLLQNKIKETRKRILKKEDSTENLKNVPDYDI